MSDGWEVANNLNPLINDSGLDPDGDGYSNLRSIREEATRIILIAYLINRL
ncbi:MAG: hypothetical protein HZA00_15195 [Nitrospinae bacterium]|nr:hypothetical protein [Nitrospinota bacterium]